MATKFLLIFMALPVACFAAGFDLCGGCVEGFCVTDGNQNVFCVCRPGFTGTLCDVAFDPCAPNPCDNGGTCNKLGNIFNCVCPLGFTGDTCNEVMNSCDSDPCKNGGKCTDIVGGLFKCKCRIGYYGSTCKKNIFTLLLLSSYLTRRTPCQGDVCQRYTCDSHRGARCQASVNGCSARFFDKFNNEITKQCNCPFLTRVSQCNPILGQMCEGRSCEGHLASNVECRLNQCGSCRAEFYDRFQKRVFCAAASPVRSSLGAPASLSPGGGVERFDGSCPPPSALLNPCPATYCLSNEDCRSDYMCCGATCARHSACIPKLAAGSCNVGQFVHTCGNVCAGRSCSSFPNARCRVESCGGCRAEFYDQYNQVINECNISG